MVFGGFAASELAARIDDVTPTVVVSASAGIEVSRIVAYKPILDRAIDLARHKPERCVILQRPQAAAALAAGRDLGWKEAMIGAEPADCVPVAALAAYLSCAELCEASYKRPVLPLFPLVKH